MTEAELERHVRELLATFRLYGYHIRDSRDGAAGFPDWVIIGRRVLWRELKSAGGDLRPEQTRLRNLLRAAGQDWDIWRPRDLYSGRIARELGAVAR